MAKSAPSKKTAKAAKTAVAGGKKKNKRARKETFGIYIHKVLKQVHPGEYRLRARRPRRGEAAKTAETAGLRAHAQPCLIETRLDLKT